MPLNDKIVDIEKPGGIYLPTFVVYTFSGLFLHPSTTKGLSYASMIDDILSYFWYWLNSDILVSPEDIKTP